MEWIIIIWRLSNFVLMTIGRVCISQLIRHTILMMIMIENKNIKSPSPHKNILLCRLFMACSNEFWYSRFHPSHTHARIHIWSNEREIFRIYQTWIYSIEIFVVFIAIYRIYYSRNLIIRSGRKFHDYEWNYPKSSNFDWKNENDEI